MIESTSKKDNRLVSTTETKVDKWLFQNNLRPKDLKNYIWQNNIKKHLKVSISSSKIRKEALDHIIFYWPPGLWKTTLSNIISSEMGTNMKSTSGPAIDKQSDLVSVLSNLENWDILFIDEIHRLRPQVEEILYTAMEDFQIDIMVWSWTWAQSVKLPLEPFTLIGATTRLSALSSPLRDRFWNIFKLDFYNNIDISKILKNNSKILKINLWDNILSMVSDRARGTPRIANRLLKILRDYHTIWKDINEKSILNSIFEDIWIDKLWLDYLDKKYLETIFTKFNWGPVWLNTIASAIWEEEGTLEDVVEPYLLQIWFIDRSPRWRRITLIWEKHIKSI